MSARVGRVRDQLVGLGDPSSIKITPIAVAAAGLDNFEHRNLQSLLEAYGLSAWSVRNGSKADMA